MTRSFGSRIREIRQSKSQRLEDVAAILNCSNCYLSQVETDKLPPFADSKLVVLVKSWELPGILEELRILAAMGRGFVKLPVRGCPEETVARVAELGRLAIDGLTAAQWKAILTIARQE